MTSSQNDALILSWLFLPSPVYVWCSRLTHAEMAEEGLLSKLTRNMVIFTSGVVIGVVALKFEQEIGRYARKKFGP